MNINRDILNALLEEVIAFPEEDEPRLKYATALESDGDHVQAEFIRTDCAITKLKPRTPAWIAMKGRLDQLEAEENLTKWASPVLDVVPELSPIVDIHFRRGFPEMVTLAAEAFLHLASDLFRVAPLRGVSLTHVKTHEAALAACPYLGRIKILDIRAQPRPLKDSELSVLLSSPYLKDLRSLCVSRHGVGDVTPIMLASSSHCRRLTRLFFAEEDITDRGVEALASWSHMQSLRMLNLQGNWVTDEGAKALIRSPYLSNLKELYLDSYTFQQSQMLDQLNPITPFWQDQLRQHFSDAHCSFSKDVHFDASILD